MSQLASSYFDKNPFETSNRGLFMLGVSINKIVISTLPTSKEIETPLLQVCCRDSATYSSRTYEVGVVSYHIGVV